MVQIAISFSLLVSKSSFPIIDIVIGFGINACQTELLVSNLNEQFRTALTQTQRNLKTSPACQTIEIKRINDIWCYESIVLIGGGTIKIRLFKS